MHVIWIILLILELSLKSFMPTDLFDFISCINPMNLFGVTSEYNNTSEATSDQTHNASEEVDFSLNEEGNLVIVLPEGYDIGELPDDPD